MGRYIHILNIFIYLSIYLFIYVYLCICCLFLLFICFCIIYLLIHLPLLLTDFLGPPTATALILLFLLPLPHHSLTPSPDQHPPPHHHHPHVAPPAFAPPQQDGPEQTARHGRSCAADRPRTQRRTRPWVGMWRCGEGGTDEAGTRDDGRVRFSMFTPPPPSLDRRRIGDDVHTAASSRKILRGQWRVTCR